VFLLILEIMGCYLVHLGVDDNMAGSATGCGYSDENWELIGE